MTGVLHSKGYPEGRTDPVVREWETGVLQTRADQPWIWGES